MVRFLNKNYTIRIGEYIIHNCEICLAKLSIILCFLSGVCAGRSFFSFLCNVLYIVICHFVLFLLVVVTKWWYVYHLWHKKNSYKIPLSQIMLFYLSFSDFHPHYLLNIIRFTHALIIYDCEICLGKLSIILCFLSGVCAGRSFFSFLCNVLYIVVCHFVLFLLVVVLWYEHRVNNNQW
jgi:hypothetical protein